MLSNLRRFWSRTSPPTQEPLLGKKAIIWETGDYLPALMTKLRELDWEIQGIVRESPPEAAIGDVAVLRPSELSSTITPDAVVIPGDATPESASTFLDLLSEFRTHYGLPNRIIHPAAFAEMHLYRRPRFLVTGLPGSGNMIAQTLYLEMIKGRQAPAFSSLDQGLIGLASAYYWSLHNLLRSGLEQHGAVLWHVSPWETAYGAMVTGPASGIGAWHISGLPLRSHIWSVDLSFSHEAPTNQTITYFTRNGFKIISLVRHPLDVIVSNAAKICRDIGLYDPGLLLSHRDWYRSMVDAVASHLDSILEHQGRLQVFRYEDLLTDPVEYLSKVQEVLGVEVDPVQMQSIWAQFGLKPLPTALGRHFWKPGEGKWRTYMNPMQKDILSRSRLPELARALGYTFDQMNGDYEAQAQWKNLTALETCRLAYCDCFYSHFLPKSRAINHPDLRVFTDEKRGLVVYGVDTRELELSSFYENFVASQLTQNLIAAAHIADRPQAPRWKQFSVLTGAL